MVLWWTLKFSKNRILLENPVSWKKFDITCGKHSHFQQQSKNSKINRSKAVYYPSIYSFITVRWENDPSSQEERIDKDYNYSYTFWIAPSKMVPWTRHCSRRQLQGHTEWLARTKDKLFVRIACRNFPRLNELLDLQSSSQIYRGTITDKLIAS